MPIVNEEEQKFKHIEEKLGSMAKDLNELIKLLRGPIGDQTNNGLVGIINDHGRKLIELEKSIKKLEDAPEKKETKTRKDIKYYIMIILFSVAIFKDVIWALIKKIGGIK